MTFLAHIDYSDIDSLVRDIDFPAMQDGPLYRIMFPADLQEEQRNEIIKWYTISMQRAYSGGTSFYKACKDDGMVVGFAGWVLEKPSRNISTEKKSKEGDYLPQALNVTAWQDASKVLMRERRRVLEGLDNVLRK